MCKVKCLCLVRKQICVLLDTYIIVCNLCRVIGCFHSSNGLKVTKLKFLVSPFPSVMLPIVIG